MLTSRKALISNLNYVHLQHVSLGVHLSLRSEMMESGQDTSLKDVPACQHQYKESSEAVLVDANSNDPSVRCRCCDQHGILKSSSNENLDTIMCDDYLTPDDLPLSPLSPSSPSTDSSSSSDFTLDDSPVSMYYKEYAHDDLETPDQPDIIPLDVDNHPIDRSYPTNNDTAETINHNIIPEDVPFIDWGSDVDSNCNTLPDPHPMDSSSGDEEPGLEPNPQSDGQELEDITDVTQPDVLQWPSDEELLPGLSVPEDSSTQTPKKTITSFHELAQRRRRSCGPSQPKKDRSDWLIVFSPDVEHPPVNELTASVFYHDLPQAQPLPEGKEVTTFRELRYRNSLNKQIGQHSRGPNTVINGSHDLRLIAEVPNNSCLLSDGSNHQDTIEGDDQRPQESHRGREVRGILKLPKVDSPEVLQDDGQASTLVTWRMERNPSTIGTDNRKEEKVGVQPRGMADGGDHRSREVIGASHPSRLLLRLSTNVTPPPALLPRGPALEVPRCFAAPSQPWHPKLPLRLSPVGASSPPHRALFPLLDPADVAILLSPFFPRTRSQATGPQGAPTGQASDTGGDGEPLMADGAGDSPPPDKKGLLVTVAASVDGIISHFNRSRNQVQKAQLGDSRLSPALGYLVLDGLCPSLHRLLADGLKPFQKDVIIGRRRLSPWSLVEASTKSGPEALHSLHHRISQLQQLRDPQRRFNAFIFGLLNIKQLDVWVSHLLQSYGELSAFFLPSGFLPLASTSCPGLREELLLILHPLSALTFHTDLLFEHHHLPLQEAPTPQRPPHVCDSRAASPFQHILGIGGWLTQNLAGNVDRDKGKGTSNDPQQHKVTHPHDNQPASTGGGLTTEQPPTSKTKDWSTTWWGQLGQASRLYIPANTESKLRGPHHVTPNVGEPGGPENLPAEPDSGGPTTARISENEVPIGGGHTEDRGRWLGQLFGASANSRDVEARTVRSRRPSSWLPPNVNVLRFIRLLSSAEAAEAAAPEPEEMLERGSRADRCVRALCDHAASGEAQLSFQKGEVLQLLSTVDEDWIRCRRGGDTGLVPVGYTSLIL